ncbi:MAG TPA: hypothetical protein VF855_04970 [Acidimicrobiales bacterium]
MSTLVCPMCHTAYESWSTKCTTCGVALVGDSSGDDPLTLPEAEQVVYELSGWPLDAQADAAAVLAEAGLPHAWAGTDLVLHVRHEHEADRLLEDVEREHGLSSDDDGESGGAAAGRDGDDGDELVYELDDWTPDMLERLDLALAAAGIPHRWEEGGVLVVAPDDEDLTETVLDSIEFPDALPVDAEGDLPTTAVDGDPELLSVLYLAADRLKGDPGDADGIADLMRAVDEADAEVPPYGVPRPLWASIVEAADELADALADEDQDRTAEIIDRAARLRATLRPFV